MDTTDPDIAFDDQGACNHCTEFLDRRAGHSYRGAATDADLERLVARIKTAGAGRQYDCVMGMSGGVDSSYCAYVARQHGLRVLAVHMDNGWNSEEAVLNIKRVTQKLGIEYESFVLNWEEFRDLQLAFLRASVPEAETPTDIAIPAALHQVAASHGIRYVVSGGNLATEGILPRCWHYNARDTVYLKHIQKTFGSRKLKSFPLFGLKEELFYKVVRRIRTVYLLNYVPYSREAAQTTLQSELNWRDYGGKHHESRYTSFIQSYYLFRKFGIDYRRATLSTQICTGRVSRADALRQLEAPPYDGAAVRHQMDYIAKKLGVPVAELEKIIEAPARWYRDYPNDEKRLGIVYDAYRKLYGREKLANF